MYLNSWASEICPLPAVSIGWRQFIEGTVCGHYHIFNTLAIILLDVGSDGMVSLSIL